MQVFKLELVFFIITFIIVYLSTIFSTRSTTSKNWNVFIFLLHLSVVIFIAFLHSYISHLYFSYKYHFLIAKL